MSVDTGDEVCCVRCAVCGTMELLISATAVCVMSPSTLMAYSLRPCCLSSLAAAMKEWEKSMPTTSPTALASSKLDLPTAQPTSSARQPPTVDAQCGLFLSCATHRRAHSAGKCMDAQGMSATSVCASNVLGSA